MGVVDRRPTAHYLHHIASTWIQCGVISIHIYVSVYKSFVHWLRCVYIAYVVLLFVQLEWSAFYDKQYWHSCGISWCHFYLQHYEPTHKKKPFIFSRLLTTALKTALPSKPMCHKSSIVLSFRKANEQGTKIYLRKNLGSMCCIAHLVLTGLRSLIRIIFSLFSVLSFHLSLSSSYCILHSWFSSSEDIL